jgi:pimeloyl-ACP methyl ester carboxylesterase
MKSGLTTAVIASLIGISSLTSAQNRPVFEKVACPTGVTATECGYVIVPENRAEKTNKTIKLFTAVVRSKAPNKFAEPLMVLTGGPGEKAAGYTALAPAFPRHDLVVFDQRGIGLSQPALECTEIKELDQNVSGTADLAQLMQKGLIACGARLKSQGIDLTAYNASESAADVNDVRVALGFEKVILYGGSYGTRLAQEVMRTYSQGLKSVVLDSVVPPQIDRSADTPRSIEESLQKVFQACRTDTACNAKYPNLGRVLDELVIKLNNKPIKVSFAGVSSDLSGEGLLGLAFTSLYFGAGISELPRLIYSVNAGQTDVIKGSFVEQFGQTVTEGVTFGAFFSHECRGEMAYSSLNNLRAAYALFPRWAASVGGSPSVSSESGFAVCQAWGLTVPSGRENEPVVSDVPTLLIGGEYDPVTPTRYLAVAAAGLKNATVVEIKGQSHSSGLGTICGATILIQFVMDPAAKLDSSCADKGKLAFK